MVSSILMRLYSVALYAYPKQFRLEYGCEMKRFFQDCCRDAGRALALADAFEIREGSDHAAS